jgi:Zn-dependent peptidase ImmA (M78 family)
MKNFNELSPSETERLSLLIEELGESQQTIGKILRHGYENYNPDMPSKHRVSNRFDLARELGHVFRAIKIMLRCDDLKMSWIKESANKKGPSLQKYLHHNKV